MFTKKISYFVLFALLIISSTAFSQSVTLENVNGLTMFGQLPIDGSTVSFDMRITGDASKHTGITNGFRVYSPNGASWTTTIGDTLVGGFDAAFDLVYAINGFSADGSGADTIGFGGAALFGPGLAPNYNEVAYRITIGPFSESDGGRTIVLDSSFFQPTGVWKWAGPTATPSWDGPHEYTIEINQDASTLSIAPEFVLHSMLSNATNTILDSFMVTGSSMLGPNLEFTTTTTSSWINLTTTSGTTPEYVYFELSRPSDITGIYYDTIQVLSPLGLNTPLYFTASIEVIEPDKFLVINPTMLNFEAVEGHENFWRRTVNISEVNNYNVNFESHHSADWIVIEDSAGITPDSIEVTIDIGAMTPGFYLDTIYYEYDEDPQDGTTYFTLVNLEIHPNSPPIIILFDTLFSLTECDSVFISYATSDLDADEVTVWMEPELENSYSFDDGSGVIHIVFNPDFSQAGDYTIALNATDGFDTTTAYFYVHVDDCDIQFVPKALIKPEMLFVYFLHAIDPMTGLLNFGDFEEGYSVADVNMSSVRINNTITPLSNVIEPGVLGFFGDAIKSEFDMNDFLELYMPFFDTTIEQFTVSGMFTDETDFSITSTVMLRGHLSGDVNLDGIIDISDLVLAVDYCFREGPEPQYVESIDFTRDDSSDISDIVALVRYLFY